MDIYKGRTHRTLPWDLCLWAINFGKAPLKSIIKAFEQAFNINLGNHYGAFTQNMLLRKESCPYFKKLMAALEKSMVDVD